MRAGDKVRRSRRLLLAESSDIGAPLIDLLRGELLDARRQDLELRSEAGFHVSANQEVKH